MQRPVSERRCFKSDIEGDYLATIRSIPAVNDRLARAQRNSRILGLAELPISSDSGSALDEALVGDAGHHKDPLIARGISDAWRDGQLLAETLITGWGEEHRLKVAQRHYQHIRDQASMEVARLNARLACLDQPLHELAEMWKDAAAAESAPRGNTHLTSPAVDPSSRSSSASPAGKTTDLIQLEIDDSP